MKTVTAQTRQVIDGLSMKWLLLLTGSPSHLIQVRMLSGEYQQVHDWTGHAC